MTVHVHEPRCERDGTPRAAPDDERYDEREDHLAAPVDGRDVMQCHRRKRDIQDPRVDARVRLRRDDVRAAKEKSCGETEEDEEEVHGNEKLN